MRTWHKIPNVGVKTSTFDKNVPCRVRNRNVSARIRRKISNSVIKAYSTESNAVNSPPRLCRAFVRRRNWSDIPVRFGAIFLNAFRIHQVNNPVRHQALHRANHQAPSQVLTRAENRVEDRVLPLVQDQVLHRVTDLPFLLRRRLVQVQVMHLQDHLVHHRVRCQVNRRPVNHLFRHPFHQVPNRPDSRQTYQVPLQVPALLLRHPPHRLVASIQAVLPVIVQPRVFAQAAHQAHLLVNCRLKNPALHPLANQARRRVTILLADLHRRHRFHQVLVPVNHHQMIQVNLQVISPVLALVKVRQKVFTQAVHRAIHQPRACTQALHQVQTQVNPHRNPHRL